MHNSKLDSPARFIEALRSGPLQEWVAIRVRREEAKWNERDGAKRRRTQEEPQKLSDREEEEEADVENGREVETGDVSIEGLQVPWLLSADEKRRSTQNNSTIDETGNEVGDETGAKRGLRRKKSSTAAVQNGACARGQNGVRAEDEQPQTMVAKPRAGALFKRGWSLSELEGLFLGMENAAWYRTRLRKLLAEQDVAKRTVLHLAAYHGNAELIQLLLSPLQDGRSGSDLHAPAQQGFQPIHFAAAQGHIECVKLFLKAGCRVNVATTNKKTPYDLAEQGGHTELAQFLKSKGGQPKGGGMVKDKDFLAAMRQLDDTAGGIAGNGQHDDGQPR